MKYPGSGGKLSGEVAVKQNSSTKAMSGCQDIPEREKELNLIYDHEQQGLIYDNGTIVVSNGPLPEIKKDSRASSHGLAILVHIDASQPRCQLLH